MLSPIRSIIWSAHARRVDRNVICLDYDKNKHSFIGHLTELDSHYTVSKRIHVKVVQLSCIHIMQSVKEYT